MLRDSIEGLKREVTAQIDKRQSEFIDLCCKIVQIPSENPPGSTIELAIFLKSFLSEKGLMPKIYEPKKDNPNIVSTIYGNKNHKNLILNGHLDTFPSGNPELWSFPPFSGVVKNGKILGRGAADMKGGLSALVIGFILIKELGIRLKGNLTLTLVSDEETGGEWGSGWLLSNVPETTGSAVLDAEPTSTEVISLGGKGICRFRFKAKGKGGHGAYGSEDNAILKMCNFLTHVMKLHGMHVEPPEELKKVIADSKTYIEKLQEGKGWIADSIVVNVGTVQGGLKRNLIPDLCEAEVDIRHSVGILPREIKSKIEDILSQSNLREIKFELFSTPPSFTSPNEEVVRLTGENVKKIVGKEPILIISPGQQDTRYWHYRNIPGINFGPRSYNMGGFDEYILVKDYLNTIKVHTCTILDYLGVGR
jgi:succinyl-diaminopimelate desuccinylase